jgi:hypothetical protein
LDNISKSTQRSLSQVINSDRLQQHSLFRPDSGIFERDSHHFNLFTVPASPKQVIPSVYSFPQFHPTPFRRLPGFWRVKKQLQEDDTWAAGMVQTSMFLSTSSFVTNAAYRNESK